MTDESNNVVIELWADIIFFEQRKLGCFQAASDRGRVCLMGCVELSRHGDVWSTTFAIADRLMTTWDTLGLVTRTL